MKVVLNKCHGGFNLSKQAIQMLRELGVGATHFGSYGTIENEDFGIKAEEMNDHLHRADPRLIKVIEELGTKEAKGGSGTELYIIEIPNDIADKGWEVDEYDGFETIHETHWSA